MLRRRSLLLTPRPSAAPAPPADIEAIAFGGGGAGSGGSTSTGWTTPVDALPGDLIELRFGASNAATLATLTVDGKGIGSGLVLVFNTTVDGSRAGAYYALVTTLLPAGSAIAMDWSAGSGNRVGKGTLIRGVNTGSPISRVMDSSSANPAVTTVSHTSGVPAADNGLMTAALVVLGGEGVSLTPSPPTGWTARGSQAAASGSTVLHAFSIEFGAAAAQTLATTLGVAKVWNTTTIGYRAA